MALAIYYDGECPVCARYIQMVRLSKDHDVSLIDLRQSTDSRDMLKGEGFDVDQGMVVDFDGQKYAGPGAVNILSLLSTPSGLINRINKVILGNPTIARLTYPFLRAGRWILLFILNKPLVNEKKESSARQEIFAIFFGLFSIFHFFNYATEYGRFPPSWDMFLLVASAIGCLLRPQSSRMLAVLMATSLISAIAQAPVHSNHTIVRNFLLLGYWLSFFTAAFKNQHKDNIFNNFAVSGGCIILIMYFFGIFHKINTDFLNPVTSCAVALWKLMPWPLSTLQWEWVHYSAIYGTFIVEAAVALALIIPRWRHFGIAAGICFHLLLSMSSYALYISFTMLSIAMHSLFLSEGAAKRILSSNLMTFIRSRRRNPLYLAAAATLLLLLGILALDKQYSLASRLALPLILPYCWLILAHGRPDKGDHLSRHTTPWIAAVVALAFFANCSMPYLGLKTAQSVNMFANIRLEGGVSNHLIFTGAHRPFPYLDNIAIIEQRPYDPAFLNPSTAASGMIYYDVLAQLADNEKRKITFSLNGQIYRNVTARDLHHAITSTLHHPWLRKWFHFQPVLLTRPEPCSQ